MIKLKNFAGLVLCFFVVCCVLETRAQQIRSEALYLHIDKSFYMPGEILWFKVYPVSDQDVNRSDVAYVELLNQEKEHVLQTKIQLGSGRQANGGSFYIPTNLASGQYTLVAYTALMKNQGGESFFSREIELVNPYLTQASEVANHSGGVSPALQFFPESGNLIQDVPTRVAFKLDMPGREDISYQLILKADSTIILKTTSNHLGIGSFEMTPREGVLYSAEASLVEDQIVVGDFPLVQSRGIVFNVISNQAANAYTFEIRGSVEYAGSSVRLQTSNRNGITDTKELRLDQSGRTHGTIQAKELPDGVVTLRLLDANNRFLVERLVFKQPDQRNKLEIRSTPGSSVYAARQKVTVPVESLIDNQPVSADFSVAVYQVNELQKSSFADIVSYHWLESDLLDPVREAAYYFDETKPLTQRMADLDRLLMTAKTQNPWEVDQLAVPEQRYHQIAFRLTDKVSRQAFVNEDVFLSVPGLPGKLYTGKTDSDGKVMFYVKDLYGFNQLAIRLVSGKESDVELISPFISHHNASNSFMDAPTIPEYDPSLKSLMQEHSLNVQTENSFFAKERAQYTELDLDNLPFYGQNARVYHLDDYTRFVRMEEVIREYVSEISLHKRRGDYLFRVLDIATGFAFDQSPLILLDGVPISNENDLIAFDPLKIEKIAIVTNRYYLGNRDYQGIVSFSTYDGLLADFPLESGTTLVEYHGMDRGRQYYSPVYDGTDNRLDRMPDTRNLLYWNPNLQTNTSGRAEFEFYTSDVPGDYLIVIEGRSESGVVSSNSTKFIVR